MVLTKHFRKQHNQTHVFLKLSLLRQCYSFCPTSSNESREESLILQFKNCADTKDMTRIHAQIIKTGFLQNVYVIGRLISFSAVSENVTMDYASKVFKELKFPDGFIYNTMIRGFSRRNKMEEAFFMYNRMKNNGKSADNFTFCFLIKICGQCLNIGLGKQLHCCVIKIGLDLHVFVSNTLIHMYSLFEDMKFARQLFDEMTIKDVVSWNTLLHGYVHCKEYGKVHEMFYRMQRSGFRPDEATLVVALSACSELGNLDFGKYIHSRISKTILDKSTSVSNSLIDMYSKCGAIDRSLLVFDSMKERNTVSWNSMILGFAMHGNSDEALKLFHQMRQSEESYRNEPNDITFLGAICACSHGGMVEEGKRYFDMMQREYSISPTIRHYGCMVYLLGKAGLLRETYKLIKEMPMEGNAIIWRTLLGACRLHGNVELGEIVKRHLAELEPDYSSDFILLANAYATKNQWNDVYGIREAMRESGVQKLKQANRVFNCFF